MAANDTQKMVGRTVVLEYATTITGGGTAPQETDWKPAGAMKTKNWDFSPNSVTSDADDAGGFPESLITNSDFKIGGEGEFRKRDKANEIGINALVELYLNAIKAREQPYVWVRLKYGSLTFVGKMIITALSSEAPTNEIVTFSVEFKVGDAETLKITKV